MKKTLPLMKSKSLKVLAVIPSRYASTRLPAKPLILIHGKPMIQWVYENVKKCSLVDKTIVATDDRRIYNVVKNFGGEVIMTSKKHKSGTDRVGEVARKIPAEIILNVQGDEPMISPYIISRIIKELDRDKKINVVTPVCKIKYYSELFSPNFVKVVFDKNKFALYFSRSVIPFIRDQFEFQHQNFIIKDKSVLNQNIFFRHIGVYGFRRNFLFKFLSLPQGKIEKMEKLEQLRCLEYGYKIKIIIVDEYPISVDTDEDLKRVKEKILPLK